MSLFAFDGSDCVSFISFTTLENEWGEFEEEAYFNSCYYQDQDQHLSQGKPSKCLLILLLIIIYHACFTPEVLQKLDYQNYLWSDYYYY